MSRFPVDIWSVKKYGIDEWHTAVSKWPMSDSEFLSLWADVDELYVGTIMGMPSEIQHLSIVLYKLTLQYSKFLSAQIVAKRLNDSGFSVVHDKRSLDYAMVMEGNIDLKTLVEQGMNVWIQTPAFRRRLRGKLGAIRANWRFHGLRLDHYFGVLNPSNFVTFGYPFNEMERYADSRKEQIRFIYPFSAVPTIKSPPESFLVMADQIARDLMSGLSEIGLKYGCRIDDAVITILQSITFGCFNQAWTATAEIENFFRNRKPTSIFVKNLWGILGRIVCLAGRRGQHKIIGANHGSVGVMFKRRPIVALDLAMTDTYLVATKGAAKLAKNLQNTCPVCNQRKVEIVSVDSDKYLQLWQKNQRNIVPASIKKAMIIEYPLGSQRHGSILGFWPYQLDLVLRLAGFIRAQGIKAILKRHPDRQLESEGLYDNYFDELISEPFEDVYEMADAYIFPAITTTTFGFALVTNRPVFFFDTMLEDIWDDARKPLQKRCRIIKSRINENSQLIFDKMAFVDALEEPPEKPDTEFIEKYMFPANSEPG